MPPSLSLHGPGADEPATVDLSGRCVGNSYVLICPVGQGATGTVWRGLDRTSGEQVAVKLLHEGLLRQPKLVTRFVQERTILMMVRHENIVGVRDLFSAGESLGLVMDFVAGGSLRDRLRAAGTLAPPEAARLLAQVAAGLAEAHALGVVHRDVKPDNILLHGSERPDVRLTDFGIARVLDAAGLTTPNQIVGTPHYMAPEIISGGDATAAADVYALGVVLYELVTGRTPYAGEPIAVMRAHLDDVPERPAGMSGDVWDVVRSCLDKDPARRPPTAEVREQFRELVRRTAGLPALPAPLGTGSPALPAPLGTGSPVGRPVVPSQACAPPGATPSSQGSGPPGAVMPSPASGAVVPPRVAAPVSAGPPRVAAPVSVVPAPRVPGRPQRPRNRPRSWVWARRGTLAVLVAVALGASGFGGFTTWQSRDAAAPGPVVTPPPPGGGGAAANPAASAALGNAPAANGRSVAPSAAAGPSAPAVPSGPAATGRPAPSESAGEVTAGPGAGGDAAESGPWICGDEDKWDLGHPVLAQPCHALGATIRVQGHLEAAPGVQADVELTVRDAETGHTVAGPHTCDGLMFTDFRLRHTCGPADLDAPRGGRYVVALSWRYTGRPLLPGGTTRGEPFTR